MPRSSKHKYHKRSKHSSKDYTDSEDDVVKTKDKSVKDESSSRVHHDSMSGEKRKMSSQSREGKGGIRDLSGHDNGDLLEEYVSSKRKKDKLDVVDRWSGGENERPDGDRNLEKEVHGLVSLKDGSWSKESTGKGESLRIESKSKSKKYEIANVSESKEESWASVLLDKEEGSGKGDSKRKHEKDSLSRKEGKESKEKHRRSDREKNGGGESKNGEVEVKLVDPDYGKEHGTQGDFGEERQSKRAREEYTERTMLDDLRNPDSDNELDKRSRKRREASSDREKYYDDLKLVEDRRLFSKSDRVKDVKHRDDKQKDGGYADKYQGDHFKDDRRRDEKNREEADKDYNYYDDKHQDDGGKDSKRRDDRHREDVKRSNRHKDGKRGEDEEGGSHSKVDKYREGIERDSRRDYKYQDDDHRDSRRKDVRNDEYDDKEGRRADENYHGHGKKDDRHREHGYGDDGDRDYRQREDKYHEDSERDTQHKDNKKMDDFVKEKRHRDTKYRDEYISRDRFSDKSEQKRSRDDAYAASHHSRKSTAYDDNPTHDDRTARYRDDQGSRRANENENDSRSRVSKDQRSDAEKRSTGSGRVELVAERGKSTLRTSEVELSSSHSRRRGSPISSSYAPRDQYRSLNPDESKYRDYKYEDRVRVGKTSSKDYLGGSEKISPSKSLEPLGQNEDGHLEILSAERFIRPDIRSSPQQLADKSPSSSMGRRSFSRQDVVRRNINGEESTQKGGGSREEKQYSAKDVRESRELGIDIPRGDELSQADGDSLSLSSPFIRNSNLSGSSKPPPPFRTRSDSPLPLGSSEDDSRGRPHLRHRRIGGDQHMGRVSGHGWRGVTSWPSPVANGYLPFPHAPPPVGFPTMVMQPFPSPPLFGVQPSMELNPAGPYPHMPETDRFPGAGRPMGWRNQVNDSFPPLHAWDASNAVFGQESRIYGRPDWDRSRNLPTGSNWDSVGDLSKGPSRTGSFDRSHSEKENNNSCRTADEVSAAEVQVDSRADDASLSKNFENKDDEVHRTLQLGETRDVAEILKKDDVCFGQVYLSKLDISADLAEPELFGKCKDVRNLDPDITSDANDVTLLYMEDAVDSTRAYHRLLSSKLFASADDSVYKKSISLYKRHKESSYAEEDSSNKSLIVTSHNGEVEKNEKPLNPENDKQGVSDALGIDEEVVVHDKVEETEQQMLNPLEEPVSDLGLVVEEKLLSGEEDSDRPLNLSESKLIDSKCGSPLAISDMSSGSEAVKNISRIHHSPESTH